MSANNEVGKTLGSWLGKAKKIAEPPQPSESKGSLSQPERMLSGQRGEGALTQINFKIPATMKKRIKQLAVRDNVTLLAMLHHMVELYEAEHGTLEKK